MEQEPNDVIILSAIDKGANKFDKIAKMTRIEINELNNLYQHLIERNFVTIVQKKGFFGPKKEIVLTDKGNKELDEKKFELKQSWDQMITMWKNGNKQNLQQYMDKNRSILPSMIFLGIMDMMMFSTMMSFMGLAMTNFLPDQYTHDVGGGDMVHDTDHAIGSDHSGGDFHGDGGHGDMSGFDVNF